MIDKVPEVKNSVDAHECGSKLREFDAQGDSSRAVELCLSDACVSNVECQRYLGWFYASNGDPNEACAWYGRATLQGSSEAMEEYFKCALMVDARGDRKKAMELCQVAPFSTYIGCQRFLARAFFEQGDMDSTLQWCLKLAECGAPDDLLYVGTLYLSRDEPQKAMKFLEQAAAAGSARANQLVGEIYAYGIGVPKDEKTAMLHYKIGAEQGLILSRVRLLHYRRSHDKNIGILAYMVCLLGLIMKGLLIKLRNPNDPRVSDIQERSRHQA